METRSRMTTAPLKRFPQLGAGREGSEALRDGPRAGGSINYVITRYIAKSSRAPRPVEGRSGQNQNGSIERRRMLPTDN